MNLSRILTAGFVCTALYFPLGVRAISPLRRRFESNESGRAVC